MGDLMKAGAEQQKEYLRLCRKYNEEDQSGRPNGNHLQHLIHLENREAADRQAQEDRELDRYLNMATIEQLEAKIEEKKAAARQADRKKRKRVQADAVMDKARERVDRIMNS